MRSSAISSYPCEEIRTSPWTTSSANKRGARLDRVVPSFEFEAHAVLGEEKMMVQTYPVLADVEAAPARYRTVPIHPNVKELDELTAADSCEHILDDLTTPCGAVEKRPKDHFRRTVE